MDLYYAEKHPQQDELHIIHKLGCSRLSDDEHRHYLGMYPDGKQALQKAQTIYEQVSLCPYCCDS